jgi:hypothetical protein
MAAADARAKVIVPVGAMEGHPALRDVLDVRYIRHHPRLATHRTAHRLHRILLEDGKHPKRCVEGILAGGHRCPVDKLPVLVGIQPIGQMSTTISLPVPVPVPPPLRR